MKDFEKMIALVFVTLLATVRSDAQDTIFILPKERFDNCMLPSGWIASSSTGNGVVQAVSEIGNVQQPYYSSPCALAMGKSTDAGGSNTNTLDIPIPLGQFVGKTVELVFWILDYYEINDLTDGIYFSNDGGISWVKVYQFNPHHWVDNTWGQLPPIPVSKLASDNGLDLTDQFMIRFQQVGVADFNTSNQEDGFLIDDIMVYSPPVVYASLPFFDDFENNGSMHPAWKSVDGRLCGGTWATNRESVPDGICGVVDNVGIVVAPACSGAYALALGKRYDNNLVVGANAMDLHLNLAGKKCVRLSFQIRDYYESFNDDEAIWFSDDGGISFTKVYTFYVDDWNDNVCGQLPPLDVDKLASDNGLTLTDKFVIRFQQVCYNDFNTSGSEDGLLIDNVRVEAGCPEYAVLPMCDGFETGVLANYWRWVDAHIGSTIGASIPVTTAGFVMPVQSIGDVTAPAYEQFWALAMGQLHDGVSASANAIDLHINAGGGCPTILEFWFYDYFENANPEDGIWVSTNGGLNFKKIYSFDLTPSSYTKITLDLVALAAQQGLTLSDSTIVRFQQYCLGDFQTTGSEDGIILDNVCVTGCSTTATFSLGSSEQVTLFPNPTGDMLQIKMPEEIAFVRASITTADGKMLHEAEYRPVGGQFGIPVQQLSNGIYLVRLEYDNRVVTKRFVKQ
jgi:hypothetical protein